MAKRYKRTRPQLQKANPIYAGMTALADVPMPRSMPRNYRSYAKEGYAQNDTLYKVINYGIQNAAAIPPRLYTDRTMQKEITAHPLLDKLDRPNPEQDGVFYRESVLGYYLIAGNSFQYAIRTAKSGPPDELWTLLPDRIRPIPDQTRGIIGYEYEDFSKEKNPILPELIGHLRTWNPNDPIFGMSAVEVAAILIDQQAAARKWNLSLLQNKAVPPGAWTTDSFLSANDRRKLEERINERMAGYRNAGKIPVLDGSLKFQPSAVAPSEMDWRESVQYNAGQIANLFNMAPQLIGDTSATTYNNMEEAKAASYTEFIFPMLDKLYSLWNRWLLPMYPDLANAYLYYDKESVEVVQNVIQARLTAAATRGNTAYMQGVATLDEAREMQGLPPLPNGAGKVFRLAAVLVPADKLQDYAEQSLTAPHPEPLDVPPDQPLQGGEGGDKQPGKEGGDNGGSDTHPVEPDSDSSDRKHFSLMARQWREVKALDLSTTEEKAAFAKSIETTRKRWETDYEKKLAAYFDQERKAVVQAISRSSFPSVADMRVESAINDQSSKLKDVLMGLYKDVCTDIGGQVAASLEGKKGIVRDFLNLFGESQLRYLLLLAGQKIKQITTTTLAKVRLELTDGVAQGEGIPELAKRIDSLYLDQIIPNRSTTIARTEVISSSNYASHEAAGQSGLTLSKVWLATGDSRTRPDHVDADGQEVDMDEPFDVGGESLMYPGDPSGSPENVINCRCTQYYKRVQQSTGDDEDTMNEKRRKRNEYRRFMEAALA